MREKLEALLERLNERNKAILSLLEKEKPQDKKEKK